MTRHPVQVSVGEARRLVLSLQGLGESHRRRLDDTALLDLIKRMGFVQVDSINMVERAHHMILFARSTQYKPADLTRLLEKKRGLFENWTHDASIVPCEFYPYWATRFERHRPSLGARYTRWHGPEFLSETERVLRHVEDNGEVLSRDLSPDERKGPGQWWNWHPSKTALEYLWRTGDLAVSRRVGFQKAYDLTHRVVPETHRADTIPEDVFIDWACRTALDRLGFGTAGEIAGYWDHISTDEAKDWCERHLGRDVTLASVEQIDGRRRTLYARPDIESAVAAAEPPPNALRILNPFDPVLRDRKRLAGLFGFDYRIEVFVPAPKRTYGYYVFPILEGDRLIGRIDMKADRAADCLIVTAFWPEPGLRHSKARMTRLEKELERHRKLSKVSRLEFAADWIRDPKQVRAG